MATGRGNQLTKQIGEYLVAAELCRRDLLATTFTGNVPAYDIVASNADGQTVLIQVKSIQSTSWQFNIGSFVDMKIRRNKQIIGDLLAPPVRNLICVLVQLSTTGQDRFFILRWKELQRLLVKGYKKNLEKHGGRRPRNPETLHTAIDANELQRYRDNWEIVEKALR